MTKHTNGLTNRAVNDAARSTLFWAVSRAVDNAVYWAVHRAVYVAVYGAVHRAVDVDGFVHEDSEHPHLQDFLLDVGTDA